MKDPLKQGLKHQTKQNIQQSFYYVEVKDPLKQGLKHLYARCKGLARNVVEVKDPLKQGLKHDRLRNLYDSYKKLK